MCAAAQGDEETAAARHAASLAVRWELEDRRGIAESLDWLTGAIGPMEALREALGSVVPPTDRPAYDRVVADVRRGVGEPAFTTAWMEGRALPPEQAVAEALGAAGQSTGALPGSVAAQAAEKA